MTIQRKISVATALAVALAFGVTSFLSYQREVKNLMDQAIFQAQSAVRYAEVATANMEKKVDGGRFSGVKGLQEGEWGLGQGKNPRIRPDCHGDANGANGC